MKHFDRRYQQALLSKNVLSSSILILFLFSYHVNFLYAKETTHVEDTLKQIEQPFSKNTFITFYQHLRTKLASVDILPTVKNANLPAPLVYTVTSTADAGAGSLQEAINNANVNTGVDTIKFNLAGSGPHTISLTSSLPSITEGVVIDGSTQNGTVIGALIDGVPHALQVEIIDGGSVAQAATSSTYGPSDINGVAQGTTTNAPRFRFCQATSSLPKTIVHLDSLVATASDFSGSCPGVTSEFSAKTAIRICDLSITDVTSDNCTAAGDAYTARWNIDFTTINAPDNQISYQRNSEAIQSYTLTGNSGTIQIPNIPADGGAYDTLKVWLTNEAVCNDTMILKRPLPCPPMIAGANNPGDVCNTVSNNEIAGTVWEDWNFDGSKNENSLVGVQGVEVKATDDCGNISQTTYTDNNGNYEFTGLTNGTTYRVEFSLPETVACWAKPTAAGTDNGTAMQFVQPGNCASFGIADPTEYFVGAANTSVFLPCYVNGDPLAGGTAASIDWFVGYPYLNSGTNTAPTQKLTGETIGAVWGVAYSQQAQRIFTSAFIKRHVGLGILGSGGIYTLEPTATSFNAATFYDLDADGHRTRAAAATAPAYGNGTSYQLDGTGNIITYLGASDPLTGQPAGLGVVGVNGSGGRALSADRTQPTNDPAAFDQVGKVGLGDLEISADGRFLFVANLYSRRIFRLELNDPANPTGVIAVESWAIDDIPNVPTCNDGTLRPFGLRYYRGKLYIGAVCTNEERATSIAGNTDLSAHIFVLNEPEAAGYFSAGAIISQTLDYTKGRSRGSQIEGFQNNIWNSWTNDFSSPFGKYPVQEVYPTPLLSDIEFTEEGNMIIAFSDRAAHQFGYNNRPLTGTSTRRYQMGGHLLFAERRPDGTYELESDGKTTNYGVAAAIRSNGEGPGGGEFFSGAFFTSGDNNPYPPNPFSGNHPSTAMGGISVLKGTGELFTTAMDAANLHSGGTLRLNNSNGGKIVGSGYQLYQGRQTSFFGKAAGLGDVTSNVPDAPLEIGNYVWCDSIQNGIQDACERGVDSLIVRLYDRNNNLVGQDTTVNGNYYFNLSNVDTTGITIDANGIATPTTGWTGLSHNTDYQIVFGFGQYQNSDGTFQVGSQVYPGFTTFNAGDNDELDSDVEGTTFFTFSGGKPRFYPEINMRTAATGCGDHRYDLGLLCGEIVYSLGNQVFLDNDNSGDLNGAETGIDGVQLRLLNSDQTVYDSDENTAGIQPLVVTTANGGYYRFDELPAGNYRIEVMVDNFAAGSSLAGLASSTGANEELAPNSNVDSNDNGIDIVNGAVRSRIVTLGGLEPTDETEPATYGANSITGTASVDWLSNLTVDFGFKPNTITTTTTTICNNNGTLGNGNNGDDTFTIRVNATNTNPGATNAYLIVYDGNTLNTGGTTYGTEITVSHPDFVTDGVFSPTLIIQDIDDNACAETVLIPAVENCSDCSPTICLPVQATIRKNN